MEPQRIGRYLDCDSRGILVSDVDIKHIKGEWAEAVNWIVEQAKNRIDSLYIRGSVPRGLAIPGVSDLDFVYISEIDDCDFERELTEDFLRRFTIARGLEMTRLKSRDLKRIYPPQGRPYFEMLLKTMSLHLEGEDVVHEIDGYGIGVDLISHLFWLEGEFSKFPQKIAELKSLEEIKEERKWFCRRLVRSGLEICLDRIQKFTRDLYLCYEVFANVYPEHERAMWSVLKNCLTGEEDPMKFESLVKFISLEGRRFKVQK